MRIYVAARFARRDEMVRDVVPALMDDGHYVTSRWLRHDNEDAVGKPVEFSATEALIAVDDLQNSDAVLVMTEEDGSKNRGGGRWFEAGFGYATGRPVVFCGPGREIVFASLPTAHYCRTLDAARIRLIALSEILQTRRTSPAST